MQPAKQIWDIFIILITVIILISYFDHLRELKLLAATKNINICTMSLILVGCTGLTLHLYLKLVSKKMQNF